MEKMTQKQFDALYKRVMLKTLADHADKHQPTDSDELNDSSNLTKVIVSAAETSSKASIEYTNDLLKNVLQALFVQK